MDLQNINTIGTKIYSTITAAGKYNMYIMTMEAHNIVLIIFVNNIHQFSMTKNHKTATEQ